MNAMYKACGKYFYTLKEAKAYSSKHWVYGQCSKINKLLIKNVDTVKK